MTDIEVMGGEAWERHKRIQSHAQNIEENWVALCAELYDFKENEDYLVLDYANFKEYCLKELVEKYSTVMHRFTTFKKAILDLGLPGPAIAEIGGPKMQEITPHITQDNADELMSQASTLPYAELRTWLKERFRPDKTEIDNLEVENEYSGKDWRILYGDMNDVCSKMPANSFDAIVTDPPYPSEFLPLFSDLAKHANRLLVNGGAALIMSGQTHLPDVYRRLTEQEDLFYRWTVSYLLPGKETRVWGRQMWTHWKPVIVLTKGTPKGEWVTDVVTSPEPDKEHHYWGQSLLGMTGLIDAFVLPKSRILDPFVGGGATIDAGRALGHYCVGIDNDKEAILATVERLKINDNKTQG